jgi:hypothetical protein
MTDPQPLPTRQFLPPRHLLPDTSAVSKAWDQADRAVTRAEDRDIATLHAEACKRVIALADLCRTDPAFASGPASKWLTDINELAVRLEGIERRSDAKRKGGSNA